MTPPAKHRSEENASKAAATKSEAAGNQISMRQFVPLGLLCVLMLTAYLQGWHTHLSITQLALKFDDLQNNIAANFITALLLYIGIYALVTALSLPAGALLTIAGGLLFGWFFGTLATVIGATLGAIALFLIVKTSLGALLKAKAGPWLDQLQQGFEDNALSYMFFLRLVPIFPFWLVNVAPAFLGVKLGTYSFATFFGIIPGTLAFTYIGQGLQSVITTHKKNIESCINENGAQALCDHGLDLAALINKDILIALFLLSLVALIPVLIKRLRSQKDQA